MKRHTDRPLGEPVVYTAAEQLCQGCGRPLAICQVISRPVEALDAPFMLVRKDRQCRRNDCPLPRPRPFVYAPRDLRVVLPGRMYGMDVTLCVGERHLAGESLLGVTRDLNGRGIPVDQRHTGRIFRDYVALAELERGDDETLHAKLRAQGGIVLMCDGVQFDERSPVLYLAWDAVSGAPLFGERKVYRGQDDLVPLLERVQRMDVPVIGVVTDKEKGLVPAVKRVFPGVPYQYCQTHFLRNCAKPLQADLTALQASVRRRAEAVREIAKRVERPAVERTPPAPPSTAQPSCSSSDDADGARANGGVVGKGDLEETSTRPDATEVDRRRLLTEEDLVREVGEIVRANSRVTGKAPLDPAELARHDRLMKIHAMVRDVGEKLSLPAKPGP